MSIQSTEDGIIENSESFMLKISEKFDEDEEILLEYKKLLKNYKKLAKRYNKTIKIGDGYTSNMMDKNDKLQTFTKKKVLESVATSRELKQEYIKKLENQQKDINDLKQKVQMQNSSVSEISNKLTNSRKESVVLKNKNISLESKIDMLKELKVPFETLLEQDINRVRLTKQPLALAMVGIDNYDEIKSKLSGFTTSENFILGIFKYLQNSLKKTDTVTYFDDEMFYVLMPYAVMESAVNTLKVLGHRRAIGQNNITLSSGITFLKDKDTSGTMMERCLKAYNNAMTDKNQLNVIKV
jgi:GGDEF domain-containing protein